MNDSTPDREALVLRLVELMVEAVLDELEAEELTNEMPTM